jgi:hypothetical protein
MIITWLERVAVWTFFLTAFAVVVALGYATLHLNLDTATKGDMEAHFAKIDTKFAKIDTKLEKLEIIRAEISSIEVKVSDSMVSHLSTAHVN